MPAKDIRFSVDARERMLKGVDIMADAIKMTLGPRGRNVVIERSFGAPRMTKDGVSVAKEIELPDRFENMGAQMLREVAVKTSELAGDGTTTATVVAQAIVREGAKAVAAGMNPMDLKRGIVRRALQMPARQIVINAGEDASIVIGGLLEQDNHDWGYDSQNDVYCDLVGAGIIDPTKVVRLALQDAASIAGLLVTTEAMVALH